MFPVITEPMQKILSTISKDLKEKKMLKITKLFVDIEINTTTIDNIVKICESLC